MDDLLNVQMLILLALPGIALLIAAWLLFGKQGSGQPAPFRSALVILGYVLVSLAIVGLVVALVFAFALILLPAALFVSLFVYFRFRKTEHQAFLSLLGVAAERGIPLAEASRAFHDEFASQTGGKALQVAKQLEQGATLTSAVQGARLWVSTPVAVAIRLGESLGVLGPAMSQEFESTEDFKNYLRPIMSKVLYLVWLTLAAFGIVTFLMLKIVPVFAKIFYEFGLKLPPMTRQVIWISNAFASGGWRVIFLLELALVIGGLLFLLAELGWVSRSFPLANRLFLRYDAAIVLRNLALGVQSGLPLGTVIARLADLYPQSLVRQRLFRAERRIELGASWTDSLRGAGFLRTIDQAVLKAAERAGNLPWALRETADSLLRREIYFWQVWYNLTAPLVVTLAGCAVGYICIALFMPLIALILGLSGR